MKDIEYTVPCLFGLEGIVAKELKRLNMSNIAAENGRVGFTGSFEDMALANLWIRCGERVLIRLGSFKATTFTELFEGVKALPWGDFIPKDAAFPVKGHSIKSELFSVPDCQSIVKKAVVECLKQKYNTSWFTETGSKYQIQFSIMNDNAVLYIDTSGAGLHKRGYRAVAGTAPLRETLAAALVELAHYRGRELLCDPFCGSGTILLEAALIAQNRAPGLFRGFAAESFSQSDKKMWRELREEAKTKQFNRDFELWGGDTDESVLNIARDNAVKAGVSKYIKFEKSDIADFKLSKPNGILISNPPYGERLLDIRQAETLYSSLGRVMRALPGFKTYIISSHTEFEHFYRKNATKKRKLYNGMIKCELYMYQ